MTTFQLLEDHQQKVACVEYRPAFCVHCNQGKRSLRLRQLVRRLVRFIENRLVHRVPIQVIVWTCSACYRSFRHLPPFLEPKMRFITPTIVAKASEVLKRRRKPYRKTIRNDPPNQTLIQYDNRNWGLSHTTVWRWIQWMAGFMSGILSSKPEMASDTKDEPFEFSPLQAKEPGYMENLYLARRLWLAQILTL